MARESPLTTADVSPLTKPNQPARTALSLQKATVGAPRLAADVSASLGGEKHYLAIVRGRPTLPLVVEHPLDDDDVLGLMRTGGDAVEQLRDRRALVEAWNDDRQAHLVFKIICATPQSAFGIISRYETMVNNRETHGKGGR